MKIIGRFTEVLPLLSAKKDTDISWCVNVDFRFGKRNAKSTIPVVVFFRRHSVSILSNKTPNCTSIEKHEKYWGTANSLSPKSSDG